jgi:TPR repeat protein
VELGRRYDKGEGVVKDHAEAAKWYRKAAEQNFAAAQDNLAICYEYGQGVAEDSVEAYKWVLLATRQGDEGAKKYMTVMESMLLTPEQIAQGQSGRTILGLGRREHELHQ